MSKKIWFAIIGLVLVIGGIILVGSFLNRDFVKDNREEIEENVREYVARYKLNPDEVVIENISKPRRYPSGREKFNISIKHVGHPYFSMSLNGNPDTLRVFEPKEHIIEKIFNQLYLEERYDEFKPVIDYLSALGVADPLRPEGTKIKYFQTSVALDHEINSELKAAFKESDDHLDKLKQYIHDHREKISRLDTNMHINGFKEGITDEEVHEIREFLINNLPESNYYVEIIGEADFETGVPLDGLTDYLKIR